MTTQSQSPCPSANNTFYTTTHPYIISCNADFPGFDLPTNNASTFLDCIGLCDSYVQNITGAEGASGAACVGVSWRDPAFGTPNCYLKYEIEAPAYSDVLFSARWTGYTVGQQPILGVPWIATGTATLGASATPSGSTSASTNPTSASVASSLTSPSSIPQSSSSNSSSTSSGLSMGAKIGLGVGIGVGALLLLIAALLIILIRRTGGKQKETGSEDEPMTPAPEYSSVDGKNVRVVKGLQEVRGHEAPELQGDSFAAELDGEGRPRQEMVMTGR